MLSLPLSSCGNSKVILENASISKEEKFNMVNVDISISSFNDLGFSFGDSCDVYFSNGYTLNDIPYYNGYYVKNGEPLIVGYPANECISITYNNEGIYDRANLTDVDTVTILLKEKGKYLDVQDALGHSYSLERKDYSSDEEFANFRSLKGGNLKENLIYRGASPLDNSRNRAKTVDNLLKENNIQSVVDLADSLKDVEKYFSSDDFDSVYAKSLYENGKIILLSMSSSYTLKPYKEALAKGFRHILSTTGPFYIHCMEGKDRTGFVSTLIEALLNASYTEMRDDYMLTYANYFKISKEKTPNKYDAIVSLYFDSFLSTLSGYDDVNTLKTLNYSDYAKAYLLDGGLSEEEINQFVTLLSA